MYAFRYIQAGFATETIGEFATWDQFEKLLEKEYETILKDDAEGLDTVQTLKDWYSELLKTQQIQDLDGWTVTHKWDQATGCWTIIKL